MAAGSQDRGRDVLIMFHVSPSVLLRVFVSVNHSMFKVHTATVVQLFLRIFFCSGGEKQPQPSLETIQNPDPIALWGRRGKSYKGEVTAQIPHHKL